MSLNKDFIRELNALETKKKEEKQTLDLLANDLKKSSSEVKALREALSDLNIPKEVKVVKSHQIDLKSSMRVVLVLFFVLSFGFLCVSVYWVTEKVSELNARELEIEEDWKNLKEAELDRVQADWLINYRNHFFELHPKDSESYLKKNPVPSKIP